MHISRKHSLRLTALSMTAVVFIFLTGARAAQHRDAENIAIDNFGCINEKFYRGAQPKKSDYQKLAAMGIKTIIDLQEDGEREEPQLVEAVGMKFYCIGLSDKSWPSPDKA